MATLAIAAGGALLGGAAGGSLGASIGWAVGGLAGSLLFPPKGQSTTGPRLTDLAVQSSAYGSGIPVLFGTMRLAGNIIWSSGLREQSRRRRIGKGLGRSPTATTFSYFASWAVGLCEGPAQAVRRIWFDDKLVFDASGASVQTEIPGLVWRFYPGDEAQLPDPMIEAAVGVANAVAHRGLCYVVFEEVPLERLGNRVPNVTCEVVMSGDIAVQNDPITDRPTPVVNNIAAIDYQSQRLWTVANSPARIIETRLGSLASRVVVTSAGSSTSGLAAIPGVGLLHRPGGGNSNPVVRYDPDSGAQTGVFGATSTALSNTTTSVTTIGFVPQDCVGLQVIGAQGVRSFLLLSPLAWQAGGYGLDADAMAYVWGSTIPGHPALFTPSARGSWVAGEQRAGESDAFYFAGSASGAIEVWRVVVTVAAAGISAGPQIGGTLGVSASRLADIPGAALGHPAGAISFEQGIFDLEDGALIIGTRVGADDRLAKITAAGAVVWQRPSLFSQSGTSHLSRLDAGLFSVIGFSSIETYSTRTGALVATQAVQGQPSIAGFQIFDGGARALYAQTQNDGARRFLVLRQNSLAVTLGAIVGSLCARAGLGQGDLATGALTETVAGYVVARPTPARAAIEPLAAAYAFDAAESDDVLRFVPRGGPIAATIAYDDLVRADARAVITETRAQDAELSRRLTVRHVDAARGYEPGAQHWQRPAAPMPTMRSQDTQSLDLPIVLTPDAAKAAARRLLTATWRERTRFALTGTTQHLRLEPTDPVTLVLADGSTQRARLIAAQLGADWTLRCEAVAEAAADYALLAAADGGLAYPPDALPAAYGIRGAVPNIPLLGDGDDLGGAGLRGYVFAGTYPGQDWRPASVWSGPLDALLALGSVTEGMAWGGVVGAVPPPPSPWTWDDATAITISPARGASRIVGATQAEVLDGANAGLLLGPDGTVEIIQHVNAAANSDGTLTLTRLLRGRRGTEDAGGLAAAIYILLDGTDLAFRAPLAALGAAETYRVQGAFQQVQEAPAIVRTNAGRAERPFAPVHIAASRDSTHNLTITWVRRTRLGGALLDGTGFVPLGEASEAYEVEIRDAADTAALRTIATTAATASYTATQQTADGLTPGAPVRVRVFQLSAAVGRGIPGRALL